MEINSLTEFFFIADVVRKNLAHFCVDLMKIHVLRWYKKCEAQRTTETVKQLVFQKKSIFFRFDMLANRKSNFLL